MKPDMKTGMKTGQGRRTAEKTIRHMLIFNPCLVIPHGVFPYSFASR